MLYLRIPCYSSISANVNQSGTYYAAAAITFQLKNLMPCLKRFLLSIITMMLRTRSLKCPIFPELKIVTVLFCAREVGRLRKTDPLMALENV